MSLSVPRVLNEHPVESLFAVALLCGLLVLGGETAPQLQPTSQIATSEKN